MACPTVLRAPFKPARPTGVLAALAASLLLGACAQVGIGEDSGSLFSALTPSQPEQAVAEAKPSDPRAATEHWGKEYAKNPRDLDAALNYAQNLKVMGQKREALAVLQQAALIHGQDRRLAADYGRLALDLGQISVAKKLLEIADDPADPNWRVVLARGTALAKEGSYRESITFFERAQALQPGHPSVMNNLALAYTMSGEPERGEKMLREAAVKDGESARVRQNLALVLGLQGKYDEATSVGSVDLAAADAQANTSLIKKMVKLDAKAAPPAARPSPAMPPETSWAPAVAEAKPPVVRTVQSNAAPAVTPSAARAPAGSAPALRASKIETGFGSTANERASLFASE